MLWHLSIHVKTNKAISCHSLACCDLKCCLSSLHSEKTMRSIVSEQHLSCTFTVFEQQIPDPSAWVRVNPGCRFIQNNHLRASNKRYCHRQLPLHATWQRDRGRICILEQKNLYFMRQIWDIPPKKCILQTDESDVMSCFYRQINIISLPERFLVCSCRLCNRPTSSSKVSSSDFTSASDKPFRHP